MHAAHTSVGPCDMLLVKPLIHLVSCRLLAMARKLILPHCVPVMLPHPGSTGKTRAGKFMMQLDESSYLLY
jgi:hypothetical protein